MEGWQAVQFLVQQTGISWQGLIAFTVFNMLTIPCFAAAATVKAELPKGKFKFTVAFWLITSYLTSTAIYLIFTWWWTVFIVAVLIALVVVYFVLRNKGKINLSRKNKNRPARE